MQKLIKISALIITMLLLIAAFAACGEKDENTLVFGTSADYAPYEFHIMKDGKDTIVGYDVSLAYKIAADMGKELTIKDINFDYLMGELKNGTVDMVIAACEVTDERADAADFSDPYYTDLPAMILVRKADAAKFKTTSDFNGVTVGAQTGTTKLDVVNNDLTGAQALALTAVPDLINNLLYNKCDAVVLDGAVALQYAESNPDIVVSEVALGEAVPYVVCVQKGDPKNLLADINKTIAAAKETGLLESWMTEATTLESQQTAE